MDFEFDSPIVDYHKALEVVESCETLSQLEVAESYVELFQARYGKTDDFFDLLSNSLLSKKMKLKTSWNSKIKKT